MLSTLFSLPFQFSARFVGAENSKSFVFMTFPVFRCQFLRFSRNAESSNGKTCINVAKSFRVMTFPVFRSQWKAQYAVAHFEDGVTRFCAPRYQHCCSRLTPFSQDPGATAFSHTLVKFFSHLAMLAPDRFSGVHGRLRVPVTTVVSVFCMQCYCGVTSPFDRIRSTAGRDSKGGGSAG